MLMSVYIFLALEACAPGMNDISARLARSGQIYDFTRDAMRTHTLNVCINRDQYPVTEWHQLMKGLPLTDAKLRAEFGRTVDALKLRFEQK